MACWNLCLPSCGAVWTFWCSDNLDYYGCKSPPLPFKSPIRLLLKALAPRTTTTTPRLAEQEKWLFGIFFTVVPSAYRAILQITLQHNTEHDKRKWTGSSSVLKPFFAKTFIHCPWGENMQPKDSRWEGYLFYNNPSHGIMAVPFK